MKSLYDFEFLVNEVFYKCWHILDYIEKHPDMSELDRCAIKATIMDALVYKKLIDPNRESLDFDNLCIRDDLNHYTYCEHPDVCGIPIWMKEKLRERSVVISAGLPVTLFLAKPAGSVKYCLYDPNTAISTIFPDAVFYDVFHISPNRNVRIDNPRPFVEVDIGGEMYLVDSLSKRIYKSSFFKERYGFEIVSMGKVSELEGDNLKTYQKQTRPQDNLATMIPFFEMILNNSELMSELAEMKYEFEVCLRKNPEAVIEADKFKKQIATGCI